MTLPAGGRRAGVVLLRCVLASASLVSAGVLRADPYPRQPIDVEHYRFALTVTDSSDRIDGDATVRLRVLRSGVARIALDLAGVTAERQGRGDACQRRDDERRHTAIRAHERSRDDHTEHGS
ncbi:MAG: M1 family metallopeptidase [Aquincola sp.]|nr:M1 family metallopeptidase [Aquincola sp.]